MTEDQHTYQRAVGASMLGLFAQIAVALGLFILALKFESEAIAETWWHAMGGLPLWICLWLVYQQHKLERLETLEAEQLAREHGTESSIFEVSADDLSVARRRLAWLYKWIVPLSSLVTATYLIGMGVWLANRSAGLMYEMPPVKEDASTLALGFTTGGIAFVLFLLSRYMAGMAKRPQWQMLRGGAGYLMGVALACMMLAITFFIATGLNNLMPLRYLSVAIPVFMVVIGTEMALNFLLDIYRPRKPGEIPRPAFDSRLLSLLTSPESIAKTINEAINYQFGFEITRSWFWQLLSKAFGWLLLVAVVAMLLMSCIIVVEPHQQALVTRYGKLVTEQPLQPGLSFKLPWPISRVRYYDVTAVEEIRIGSDVALLEDVPILWSNQHTEGEDPELLIVAPTPIQDDEDAGASLIMTPIREAETGSKSPSNAVINAEVMLFYRIHPQRLIDYVKANADSDKPKEQERDKRVRNIASAEVSRYMLRHTVDEWIGSARVGAGAAMARAIQAAADAENLGIEIIDVAVAAAHPPLPVADTFHEVVGAEQERLATVEQAHQTATRILAEVAGSTELAELIVAEIEKLERLGENSSVDQEQLEQQQDDVEQLLREAGGAAAVQIAEARAYRWEKENAERGRADRFEMQLLAFRISPDLFINRQIQRVLTNSMANARKYFLLSDRAQLTLRLDLKDSTDTLSTGFDIAGEDVERDFAP